MIDIEYWGDHQFDRDSKTLYFNRNDGLCSNLSILIHLIGHLRAEKGFIPQKIVTKFKKYKDCNIYEKFVYIDKLEKWENYNIDNVKRMLSKATPTWWGWGSCKEDIDIETANVIRDVYLNYKDLITVETEKIYHDYNIDKNNFNFLFWRLTDKTYDIPGHDYPELDDALKCFKGLNNLYAHTDDNTIYNILKNKQINVLDVLPRDPNKTGGHHYVNNLTEHEYLNLFKHTHDDHVARILALLNVAAKSNTFVGYPGNMSFYICLLRESFNNVYFFRAKNKFY